MIRKLTASLLLIGVVSLTLNTMPVDAAPVEFTMQFPGGFSVSVNGGPLSPSGPISLRGIVDDAAVDTLPMITHGEFPLTNARLTGAGFVDRPVTTLLSLTTYGVGTAPKFAFQRRGEFNEGIVGWNGDTLSVAFMTNVNNLSTLGPLPYSTTGISTFWYDGLGANVWTLQGGDTIGGNIGAGGPSGVFSIRRIPEPSALALAALGLAAIAQLTGGGRSRRAATA